MTQKSLKHIILLNLGAFVLVLLLELMSNWIIKDKLGSDYALFMHSLNYTVHIMGIIWINHFILIPFVLDKKRYLPFTILLVATILAAISTKINFEYSWTAISKFFFFFLYTTGTGMAAFFLRRNMRIQRENSEKEKLQKEMELNYLKEQVNPHFLFNSLNSIYSLSRKQSPETPDVVMQLSELMRYQLESSKKDMVLVQEELEFIENYVLLEEKRLSQRCQVEFTIEGDVSGLKIAPMLLIPFVENALKHGAQSTNEPSTIDISATIRDTTLHFSVVNSKPSRISELKSSGLGLSNVKRRLNLLYPGTHSLKIDDTKKTYRVTLAVDLTSGILKE